MKKSLVVLAIVAFAATLACGDRSSVGDQNLLNHIPSPSPVASPSPSPKPAPPSPVAVRTAQAPKPVPVAATATIDIIANSPYFQPQNLRASRGTVVKFVNEDQQPDKVQIMTAAGATVATSPQLMPGQSWSYTFSSPGSFAISDRRPYAQGSVTIS